MITINSIPSIGSLIIDPDGNVFAEVISHTALPAAAGYWIRYQNGKKSYCDHKATIKEWLKANYTISIGDTNMSLVQPKSSCDCGGTKARTTHSNWCSTQGAH